MAAVAQREPQLISAYAKAALQAARARGTVLGRPENLTQAPQLKGEAVQREAARLAERPLLGYVRLLRDGGHSLRSIAARLNSEGHTTRTGKSFTAVQVNNMLGRSRQQERQAESPGWSKIRWTRLPTWNSVCVSRQAA